MALDQQAVGCLSRMDVLQRQATAPATRNRRAASASRIRAALDRLDAGEFGNCATCGDDIALARLHLGPAVMTCITCASG